MATEQEVIEQLNTATAKLISIETQVKKIGTETDGLQEKIKALEEVISNQGNPSPALVAALDALKAQADTLAAATTVVDEKVPDAPA